MERSCPGSSTGHRRAEARSHRLRPRSVIADDPDGRRQALLVSIADRRAVSSDGHARPWICPDHHVHLLALELVDRLPETDAPSPVGLPEDIGKLGREGLQSRLSTILQSFKCRCHSPERTAAYRGEQPESGQAGSHQEAVAQPPTPPPERTSVYRRSPLESGLAAFHQKAALRASARLLNERPLRAAVARNRTGRYPPGSGRAAPYPAT